MVHMSKLKIVTLETMSKSKFDVNLKFDEEDELEECELEELEVKKNLENVNLKKNLKNVNLK